MKTFGQLYSDILTPFVKKYKEAKNDKGRKAVIKNAVDAVSKGRELLEDGAGDLPNDLPTTITRFIKRQIEKESKEPTADDGEPESNRKPKKAKRAYTIRDVIKQKHRDLVDEEIPFKPSDREYLGSYQKAVTTVLEKMSEEDVEELEKVVELWNKEGGPSDVQLKKAKGRLGKDMKKTVEDWKFQTGAIFFCMAAYSDGKEVNAFCIESSPVAGSAFTISCKDWQEGTFENFKEWAAVQFGEKEQDSDEEAEVPVDLQKAKDIVFKKNKRGIYVLPPLTDYKNIRQKQRVVRGYIGAVFRDFTGHTRAAFPYILASKDDQMIYSPECVPDGFTLSDPDHLKTREIESLYRHWLDRQEHRQAPFIILNGGPNYPSSGTKSEKARGKQRGEWVDVNSDDDDVVSQVDKKSKVPKDDDDEEEEEEEEEEGGGGELSDKEEPKPAMKYGPPNGGVKKEKKNNVNAKTGKVAGEKEKKGKVGGEKSEAAAVGQVKNKKDGAKKNNPKKTKQGTSKKRNAEEGLDKEGPPKKAKTGHGGKSMRQVEESSPEPKKKAPKRGEDGGRQATEGNVGGSSKNPPKNKRKRAEEGDGERRETERNVGESSKIPPVKKPKHVEKEASPPPPPARSRVKEFPAGNVATSASRIAFLRSICKLPKFGSFVDLIQAVPKASTIPPNYPPWASWSSKAVYLPSQFHTPKSFKNVLSIVEEALTDSSILESEKIDAPLLLLGLTFREVSRAMEIEPGDDSSNFPSQLVNSPFGIREVETIEKLLKGLRLPSK